MITEINESNELQNKTTTMCVCCENIIVLQHNTLEFEQQKYPLKGKFAKILQSRTIDMTMTTYICNACDLLLRNGQFPVNILQNSSSVKKYHQKYSIYMMKIFMKTMLFQSSWNSTI